MTSIQDYLDSIKAGIAAIERAIDTSRRARDAAMLEQADHLIFTLKDRAINDGTL